MRKPLVLAFYVFLLISNGFAEFTFWTTQGKAAISEHKKSLAKTKSTIKIKSHYAYAFFKAIPTKTQRRAMEEGAGIKFISVYDVNSQGIIYVVKIKNRLDNAADRLSGINRGFYNLELITNDDRISRKIKRGRGFKEKEKGRNGRVIAMVHCFEDIYLNECASALKERVEGKIIERGNGFVIEEYPYKLRAIGEIEKVKSVYEKDTSFQPVNHFSRELTKVNNFQKIDTSIHPPTTGWMSYPGGYQGDSLITGDSIKVGIWDSGIDSSVLDFKEAGFSGNVYRIDFSPGYTSGSSHGTHVAGICCGNGWQSGLKKRSRYYYRGVAPKSILFSLSSIHNADGDDYDVNNHSHIISPNGFYTTDEVDNVLWPHSRILPVMNHPSNIIVYAAANNGIENRENHGPQLGYYSILADSKNPIVVGACYKEKIYGNVYVADFSSKGPTRDGRIKPDIVAPGASYPFPVRGKTAGAPNLKVEIDYIKIGKNVSFDFDTDSENWTINFMAESLSVADSVLRFQSYWKASNIHNLNVREFAGNPNDSLKIRYRFTHPQIPGTINYVPCQFAWADTKDLCLTPNCPTGTGYVDFNLSQPDANFHDTSFALSDLFTYNENENGTIHYWMVGNINSIRKLLFYVKSDTVNGITSNSETNESLFPVYRSEQGTSMAAPHVTGIVALMLEKYYKKYLGGKASSIRDSAFWNSTAKAILIHTAEDLVKTTYEPEDEYAIEYPADFIGVDPPKGMAFYPEGPDYSSGYGLVDAEEALRFVDTNLFKEDSVEFQQEIHYGFDVNARSSIRVTLAWDDLPGNPHTPINQSKLVNDLDMVLVSPGGDSFFPWVADTLPQSAYFNQNGILQPPVNGIDIMDSAAVVNAKAVQGINTRDNVEVIDVANPESGTWTIKIFGKRICFTAQDFSLVADDTLTRIKDTTMTDTTSWNFRLPPHLDIDGPMAFYEADSTLFLTADSLIYAYCVPGDSIKWSLLPNPGSFRLPSAPVLDTDGGYVFFSAGDSVFCYDLMGARNWVKYLGGIRSKRPVVDFTNDVMYVSNYNSGENHLILLNSNNGVLIDSVYVSGEVEEIIAFNDMCFAFLSYGTTYFISKTGEYLGEYNYFQRGAEIGFTPVASQDGKIMASSEDEIVVMNEFGHLLQIYQEQDIRILSNLALDGSGNFYFIGYDAFSNSSGVYTGNSSNQFDHIIHLSEGSVGSLSVTLSAENVLYFIIDNNFVGYDLVTPILEFFQPGFPDNSESAIIAKNLLIQSNRNEISGYHFASNGLNPDGWGRSSKANDNNNFREDTYQEIIAMPIGDEVDLQSAGWDGSHTKYHLCGASEGMGGIHDNMLFSQVLKSCEFDVVIKIDSISNSGFYDMAGILAVETTSADSSPSVFIGITMEDSTAILIFRDSLGAAADTLTLDGKFTPNQTWVRLKKFENNIIAALSSNGIDFVTVGDTLRTNVTEYSVGPAYSTNDLLATEGCSKFSDFSIESSIVKRLAFRWKGQEFIRGRISSNEKLNTLYYVDQSSLYAYDMETNALKWTKTLPSLNANYPVIDTGNGLIYLAINNSLYCYADSLDSAALIWDTTLNSGTLSSPALNTADSLFYVVSEDSSAIYILNSFNGSVLHKTRLGYELNNSSLLSLNNKVIVNDEDNNLHFISDKGVYLGGINVGVDISDRPAVTKNGKIIVYGNTDAGSAIYILNENGQILKEFPFVNHKISSDIIVDMDDNLFLMIYDEVHENTNILKLSENGSYSILDTISNERFYSMELALSQDSILFFYNHNTLVGWKLGNASDTKEVCRVEGLSFPDNRLAPVILDNLLVFAKNDELFGLYTDNKGIVENGWGKIAADNANTSHQRNRSYVLPLEIGESAQISSSSWSGSKYELCGKSEDPGSSEMNTVFAYMLKGRYFDISVKLDSVYDIGKAGILAINDTSNGASAFGYLWMDVNGLLNFEYRLAEGDISMVYSDSNVYGFENTWIKMEKIGDSLISYISFDSENYNHYYAVEMGMKEFFAGLAYSSDDDDSDGCGEFSDIASKGNPLEKLITAFSDSFNVDNSLTLNKVKDAVYYGSSPSYSSSELFVSSYGINEDGLNWRLKLTDSSDSHTGIATDKDLLHVTSLGDPNASNFYIIKDEGSSAYKSDSLQIIPGNYIIPGQGGDPDTNVEFSRKNVTYPSLDTALNKVFMYTHYTKRKQVGVNYIDTIYASQFRFIDIDISTGRILNADSLVFTFPDSMGDDECTRPIATKHHVFFVKENGDVFKFRSDGGLIWHYKLLAGESVERNPVITDNNELVIASDTVIHVYDANYGLLKYRVKISFDMDISSNLLNIQGSLYFVQGAWDEGMYLAKVLPNGAYAGTPMLKLDGDEIGDLSYGDDGVIYLRVNNKIVGYDTNFTEQYKVTGLQQENISNRSAFLIYKNRLMNYSLFLDNKLYAFYTNAADVWPSGWSSSILDNQNHNYKDIALDTSITDSISSVYYTGIPIASSPALDEGDSILYFTGGSRGDMLFAFDIKNNVIKWGITIISGEKLSPPVLNADSNFIYLTAFNKVVCVKDYGPGPGVLWISNVDAPIGAPAITFDNGGCSPPEFHNYGFLHFASASPPLYLYVLKAEDGSLWRKDSYNLDTTFSVSPASISPYHSAFVDDKGSIHVHGIYGNSYKYDKFSGSPVIRYQPVSFNIDEYTNYLIVQNFESGNNQILVLDWEREAVEWLWDVNVDGLPQPGLNAALLSNIVVDDRLYMYYLATNSMESDGSYHNKYLVKQTVFLPFGGDPISGDTVFIKICDNQCQTSGLTIGDDSTIYFTIEDSLVGYQTETLNPKIKTVGIKSASSPNIYNKTLISAGNKSITSYRVTSTNISRTWGRMGKDNHNTSYANKEYSPLEPKTIGSQATASHSGWNYAHTSYTICGNSSGIGAASDNLLFAFELKTGNFEYSVRLDSFDSTGVGAKAGIMAVTDTSEANNPNGFIWVTNADSGGFSYRMSVGGQTHITYADGIYEPGDTWLLIRKIGAKLIGYISDDGETYIKIKEIEIDSDTLFTGPTYTSGDYSKEGCAVFADFYSEPIESTYPEWRYFTKLTFNTTSSGAGVSEDIYDFPVLLRLNQNNFSFSQAGSNGSDIRFSDPDGSILDYEIESWDMNNQTAEIWINVSRIDGSSNTDFITMHWGNDTASDKSNSQVVFNTANGFRGVWHMRENPDGGQGNVKDATGTNHATGNNMASDDLVHGIIGNAIDFDGNNDYLEISTPATSLQFTDEFTISAWVKIPSWKSGWQQIISRQWGTGSKDSWLLCLKSQFEGQDHTGIYLGNGTVKTGDESIQTNQWYHLTATKNGNTHTIYLNGEQKQILTSALSPVQNDENAVGIGGQENGNPGWSEFLRGIIDEVRASNISRPAGWIKLAYENQKENQSLIEFPREDDPANVLFGFESIDDWSVSSGTAGLAYSPKVEGQYSLKIEGGGYQFVNSRLINTEEIDEETAVLAVDLYLGHTQPNPFWLGQIQLFIDCPSASINNQHMGNVELTSLDLGQFHSMQFALTQEVVDALQGSYTDFKITFGLNTNESSGPYYLDNMRFE